MKTDQIFDGVGIKNAHAFVIPDIPRIILGICFYKANIVNRFLCHRHSGDVARNRDIAKQ